MLNKLLLAFLIFPAFLLRAQTIDTLNYIMGKFDPSTQVLFKKVPVQYASRKQMYLRTECIDAFIKMYNDARQDGVSLKIISATRNFYDQKMIWENKWTGKTLIESGINLAKSVPEPIQRAKRILEYSSMPGSSRHHWGTDLDLNSLENKYFDTPSGKKIYQWLIKNASAYGFCQPYTAGRKTGYKEERWHWSYIPIAIQLTDYCSHNFNNKNIAGFLGSETAVEMDVLTNYILAVNPACR